MSKSVKPAKQQDIPEAEPPAMTARQAGAHVAVAARLGDAEREVDARRNLAEAKIAEAIERELAKAPRLTPGQVSRLYGLLRTGGERQDAVRVGRNGLPR